MSVTISIETDGRVESRHNSGRIMWARQIDVGAWGDGEAPADLAISEADKLFLDDVTEEVAESPTGSDGPGETMSDRSDTDGSRG